MNESDMASEVRVYGPANLKLHSDDQLRQHLRSIATAYPVPAAIGIGMAGTRTDEDRARLRGIARSIWPGAEILVTHDLETALAAADLADELPRVLILSGTGSCCYGRGSAGSSARIGGWGHLLGDQGSGYDVARRALRGLALNLDATGRWPQLGRDVLHRLGLGEPDHLVGWIHSASKDAIAALAPLVFEASRRGDPVSREVLRQAAEDLAIAAVTCARRLTGSRASSGSRIQFVLAGGVLVRQPGFARRVRQHVLEALPKATFHLLKTSGAIGAARLASRAWVRSPGSGGIAADRRFEESNIAGRPGVEPRGGERTEPPPRVAIPESRRLSPTEARNPRSLRLDRLRTAEAVELMLQEERRVPLAVLREKRQIVRALSLTHAALKKGGRLFYVGAGTSGRLGCLDASECPPTFRSPPEQVQSIIAGGREAVFRSVEGAEDDIDAGRRAIAERGIEARDVVVGIAASGRTPFVWGALSEARARGAPTILVCFNPYLEFARGERPEVVIAPKTGPEVLTGSTRLKAGTATKLILNLLSTLSMVRLGKVVSNLMVDLDPVNAKLRDRAIRITRELTGLDGTAARRALETHDWSVHEVIRSRRWP